MIGWRGTVTKRLVQELEELEIIGLVETLQTTALFEIGQNSKKSPGDLRSSFCHSDSSWKPLAIAGVKNSQNE